MPQRARRGRPSVGGTAVIPITNAPAGKASLAIRYANGTGGPQTLHLDVNGTSQQLSLPSTGGWDKWGVVNVPVTLNSGANTLKIVVEQGDGARVNVDYLGLHPDGSQPPTDIASATAGRPASTSSRWTCAPGC